MSFMERKINEIRGAKNDDDIRKVLLEVYMATQVDSKIREEFDNYSSALLMQEIKEDER